MNRKQFEERNRGFNIPQHELDRMYRVHQEQMMMEQLMMEAARQAGAVSSSAGPGGSPTEPTGLVISSSDFVNGGAIYQDTTAIGVNGNEGFDNTAPQSRLDQGYYGNDLTADLVTRITDTYVAAGLDPNDSDGYVWTATWGAGSSITTGLIKFGFNNAASPTYFDIQTIDPADPDWELPGYTNGTSLAGTFLFPLTINIYTPLVDKGGWC